MENRKVKVIGMVVAMEKEVKPLYYNVLIIYHEYPYQLIQYYELILLKLHDIDPYEITFLH